MCKETDPLLPRHRTPESSVNDHQASRWIWNKATISFVLSFVTIGLTLQRLIGDGWLPTNPPKEKLPSEPVRVAIVGGGPAGVFAAARLHELSLGLSRPVEITIFERKYSLGGRLVPDTPTHPFDDDREMFLSAEASSYTSPTFDLNDIVPGTRSKWWLPRLQKNVETTLYVYNKPVELTRPSSASSFKSRTWEWWCFGYSVNGAKSIALQFRKKLQNIQNIGVQDSVGAIVDILSLRQARSQAGAVIFAHHGVGKAYINRIVKSESRVQFGQEADSMNEFTLGMMAYAADLSKSQDGGNLAYELEGLLLSSEAIQVRLGTDVFGLRKLNNTRFILAHRDYRTSQDEEASLFDAVILAAPMASLQLEVRDAELPLPSESMEYLARHITWFTSAQPLDKQQIGQKELKHPRRIITRLPQAWKTQGHDAGAIEIYDMGFHVRRTPGNNLQERLYRVISDTYVTDENVRELLGGKETSWIARREIKQGYPVFGPQTSFSSFVLDDAIWHSSVIEELHSSVGMSAWAGRNVASLAYEKIKEL